MKPKKMRTWMVLFSALAAGCGGSAAAPVGRGAAADLSVGLAVSPGTLVDIPSGSFVMGCDPAVHPECQGDESPVHTVQLSAFRIEATEVTYGQWQACIDAFSCTEPVGGMGDADLPITGVGAEAAAHFCDWAGMRLPTEAEWERVARGPDGRLYPGGDTPPDCDHAISRPCDGGLRGVASRPGAVTSEGVYDMAGNAWEWVSDYYSADYYAGSVTENPTGPSPRGLRIVRGVDAWSDESALRATNRSVAITDGVSVMVGFRCVVEAP